MRKKIIYSIIGFLMVGSMLGCGNSSIPNGMSKEIYNIGYEVLELVESFQKGEIESLSYLAGIKKLESELSSQGYKPGSEEYNMAFGVITATVSLEKAPYDTIDDLLRNKEYLMSKLGMEITEEYHDIVPFFPVPDHWLDNYEYGKYSLYNSHADENGLKGAQIWIEGKVDSSFVNENSQTGKTEYCSLVKIGKSSKAEDEYWMVIYSDEILPTVDIDEIQGQNACMIGEYMGYTDQLQAPVLLVEDLYAEAG